MTSRIESLNGTAPKSNRKASKPQSESKAPSAVQRRRAAAAESAVRWSHAYTCLAVATSAGLNAYASCQAAETVYGKAAGALLGAAVPVFVWVLAKVTAWTYKAGWYRLSYVPGIVACILLALSVTHCASAFAALTGTGLILSGCLAVGIDCGLVASEATGILVSTIE